MSFTNYLDAALLEHVFGGVAYTPPASLYAALSSSAPTQYPGVGATHNFTEATGPGYARSATVNNGTNWILAAIQPTSGAAVVNGFAVAFPASTGPWSAAAILGWLGLFDAATGGNLLAFGPITPTLSVPGPGYLPSVPAGSASLTLI